MLSLPAKLLKLNLTLFITFVSIHPSYAAETKPKISETNSNAKFPSDRQEFISSKNMEHIEVKGVSAAEQVSGITGDYKNKEANFGPLGNMKLEKAPFSVMQASHDVVENQQLRTMDQATEYMPSVQLESVGPSSYSMVNRGFTSNLINNSRIDGLNVVMSNLYTTETFESMSVLNGSAGALYGPENPAGLMEMTLKRPTDKPLYNFNFGYDSNAAPLESLDVSHRWLKGRVGARLNLLNQSGQGWVAGSHMWRDSISGDFDFQITKNIKFELDAGQYSEGKYGFPGQFLYSTNVSLPKAPSAHHEGYGESAGGVHGSNSFGAEKLFWKINNNWRVRLGGLYQDSSRKVIDDWNFVGSVAQCSKAGISGPCYAQDITAAANTDEFKVWSNFAYLEGQFDTGSILGQKVTHHINVGSNGFSVSNYSPESTTKGTMLGYVPFYSPQRVSGISTGSMQGQYKTAFQEQQSFIFGDNFDIGKYISIMGQFSFSWISSKNFTKTGAILSKSSTSGAFSPTVTLSVHPTDKINAYFSWAKSVTPGNTIPQGAIDAGGFISPVHSTSYEGGVKWTATKNLQLNVDGFVMTSPFAFSNPFCNERANCSYYGYLATQKDYGVEFQASGKITKDLSILAGFTWDHAIVGKAQNALIDNKRVPSVPTWAANILVDYRVPKTILPGLAFNANFHYVGGRTANVTASDHIASYATLDLGARYSRKIFNRLVGVRFTVNNVTGENYWSSAFPLSASPQSTSSNFASLGLPRTWQLTSFVYF